MLTVLDLFGGIGGFSLGLERTGGFKTKAFCEIDTFCRQVLAKHWPGVPIHEDVTKLRGEDVGSVDVIAGGFPCQDVSLAGRREGLAGSRSGLWSEFVRLIGEIRPRYAIVENVPGLLHNGMGRVCGDLAEIGFDAEWDTIPTGRAYGHHRERVLLVAYPMQSRLAERRNTDPNGAYVPALFARQRFASVLAPSIPGEKWADRPLLGRGISRIPNRVDRVKALGNAVNPQVVEVIGNAILEAA